MLIVIKLILILQCEELSTSGEDAGPTPRKQSKHQRELTGM